MKQKLSIPSAEQELLVNYSPDMGKMCEVYTSIPWMMKYLDRMAKEYPDQYKIINDDQYSLTVKTELRLVKPRKPRIVSEETKALSKERLKLINRKQT